MKTQIENQRIGFSPLVWFKFVAHDGAVFKCLADQKEILVGQSIEQRSPTGKEDRVIRDMAKERLAALPTQ